MLAMRLVAQQFLECQMIPENAIAHFDAAIAAAIRLRNSVYAYLSVPIFF